jgi:hypothetical protein
LSRVELLVKHSDAQGKSSYAVQETSMNDPQMKNSSLQQQQQQSNMNAYKKKVQTAQIHFSFVTSRKEGVSEETLRETFSSFGYMLEINIKKADYNPVTIFFRSFKKCFNVNFRVQECKQAMDLFIFR